MCGITGFLNLNPTRNGNALEDIIQKMNATLVHRGPDDGGIWVDHEAGIAFGHRRLSILDLSPEGHQPMLSDCGRYVIIYNGEVYNYLDIRKDLESEVGNIHWHGHSDTEVMLAAITRWGIMEAVKRFNGMFAFALWDRNERELHLVRDRLGIKPLYYGWERDFFLFGSELKSIRMHPDWKGEISRDAVALFMRFNYIPAPYSIYRNVFKLSPGTILTLSTRKEANEPLIRTYWSARVAAENGEKEPFPGNELDAKKELDRLLRSAVGMRMIADVPLGAFLSGGIDSSTVVAMMQAQSNRPVKTFSIGLNEDGYNEAENAMAVARHLGTDHTELYVTSEEAREVIPQLPSLYDEPFSDSSQIPTFLISKLARQQVTVSLSGDGGDELFGGYTRYFLGRDIWQYIGWLPRRLRMIAARRLTAVSQDQWDHLFRAITPIVPRKLRQRLPGDKIHKLAGILSSDSPDSMYYSLISNWKNPVELVPGACELSTTVTDRRLWADLPDFTKRMMFLDLITYLPDDILTKVDRASMGVSLEARVPLLDYRIVEFAWRLPLQLKIRNGQGKWLLRQVLYQYVPRRLIERPKTGFGVPIDSWLRGPLRDWAEALLDEKRLRQEGFFNPEHIRLKWHQHFTGKQNCQHPIWNILMFQAWLEGQSKFKDFR